MAYGLAVLRAALQAALPPVAPAEVLSSHSQAPHYGVWQVKLESDETPESPFFEAKVGLRFQRPDNTEAVVEAFYAGDKTWIGRAYCDAVGTWRWRSQANLPSLDGKSGAFEVRPSDLPGKLRSHPRDPHQFCYDNGDWFLHIGDTGYRYLTDTEPLWGHYMDEAAKVGFTKIRTWFCRSRGGVEALFRTDRSGLDLAYWDEMEGRLRYALERYPRIQFQLIPYGEDTKELLRYAEGDRAAQLVARYAQARFSAFPNVHWCISNDRDLSDQPSGRTVPPTVIEQIARDMRSREPWRTLLTNHQKRGSGYAFVEADWSDIITLEDLDQVGGEILLKYRRRGNDPVVNDEDRYGLYRPPKHQAYFFRRLMWASLLSGGHATYGGLKTYEAYDGPAGSKGVQGYLTAVADGRLPDGAGDFGWIHKFFAESGLTLVGFEPADEWVGGRPRFAKAARKEGTILIYAQNPDSEKPETADYIKAPATVPVQLPAGLWSPRWFNPRSGEWRPSAAAQPLHGGRQQPFTAPFEGDAVLWLTCQ